MPADPSKASTLALPKRSKPKRASVGPARAWQRMLSGRRLDLLDPSPLDIEIEDIAHGLARVARWNGQTLGEHAFSVAQHSVIVEKLVCSMRPGLGPQQRLTALLHDAPEYVIGDMISPFKAALGLDYRAFEDRLEAAIHARFALPLKTPPPLKALIKQADIICAAFEAVALAGFSPQEARAAFGPIPENLRLDVSPLSTSAAQSLFLERFHALAAGEIR